MILILSLGVRFSEVDTENIFRGGKLCICWFWVQFIWWKMSVFVIFQTRWHQTNGSMRRVTLKQFCNFQHISVATKRVCVVYDFWKIPKCGDKKNGRKSGTNSAI